MTATKEITKNFDVKNSENNMSYLDVLLEEYRLITENQEKALNYMYDIVCKAYKILGLDMSFMDTFDFHYFRLNHMFSTETIEELIKGLKKNKKDAKELYDKFNECFRLLICAKPESLNAKLNSCSLEVRIKFFFANIEFLRVRNFELRRRAEFICGLQRMIDRTEDKEEAVIIEEIVNMLLNPELALK